MSVYVIQKDRYDFLKRKLAGIEKRLSKYGTGLTFRIVRETKVEVLVESKFSDENVSILKDAYEIEVSGEARINGYKVLAMLTYVPSVNRNTITSFTNDEEYLYKILSYAKSAPICEHCNTNRKRKYTYLVEKDGEIKQIGKTCMNLYTSGINAEKYAEAVADLVDILEEEKNFNITAYENNRFPVWEIFAVGLYFVDKYGYVATSSERDEKEFTVSRVKGLFKDYVEKYEFEEYYNENKTSIEEKTSEIINWLYEQDANSVFMNNVKTLLEARSVEEKDIGFIVGAISCFNRNKEKEERKKSYKKIDYEYAGKINDKIIFEGICKVVSSFENYYNGHKTYSYFYVFDDTSSKHIYKWITSSRILENGQLYRGTGTIKALEVDKYGNKITVLTRCKM